MHHYLDQVDKKNDLPTVCKFGCFDDSMKDALTKISENGMSSTIKKGNVIISDSLTIIGNNDKALFFTFMGGKKHLIKVYIYIDNKGLFKRLEIYAEINKLLKPNEEFVTEDVLLYISYNTNKSIKEFSLSKIKTNNIIKKHYSVYSTWYYYGQSITLQDAIDNLNKIKELKLPFNVFQIDDGWEDLIGSWNTNNKFNITKKDLADLIKSYNLIPGIWTSPFIAEKDSSIIINHPEWILYNNKNKPCIFNVNNKDYYIIDISIKDTWDYFEKMYHDLTINDGFYYHKLDFTRAFLVCEDANYYDKYSTPVENYVNCIKHIRKGMTDKAFFLMCGGLYDSLIGIVDAQRTSSDVLSMWSSNINIGGKTIPYTIKQNILRYYMSYWWCNDPDALIIRRNNKIDRNTRLSLGLLNDEEVKSCVINQLLGCGIISTTEKLDSIDKDRIDNLYKIIPINNIEIEIDNLLSINRYPDKIYLFNKDNKESIYFIRFNFDDNKVIENIIDVNYIIEKGYLHNRNNYTIIDYYGKTINKVFKNDSIKVSSIKPHSANIICITTKNIDNYDFNGHYILDKDKIC